MYSELVKLSTHRVGQISIGKGDYFSGLKRNGSDL